MSGDLIGTLRYMSPEQALAKRVAVDHRTDVYSLGVTLYELLTLKPAYAGKDRQELLRQIAFEEPRAVGKLNPAVPGELQTIVGNAMAKNPADRYATAQELADDLRRFLEDKPIHAKRPTVAQRVAKWSRRHRPIVVSGAIASAMVLIAVAVGGALIAAKEREGRVAAVQAKNRETQLRLETETLLVSGYVDKAQALCEQGEIGRGMLWFAHSLRKVPEGAADLERVIRTNLSAWSRQLHSLSTLVRHPSQVIAVALNRQGSRILTVCSDGTVKLWDARRPFNEPLCLDNSHSPVCSQSRHVVAISPDGSIIATGGGSYIHLWDAVTGNPKLPPIVHGGMVLSLAFSADGTRLVSGGNTRSALLWDVSTGQRVGTPLRQRSTVLAVDFSADGKHIVTGSQEGAIRLWDMAPTSSGRQVQHQDRIVNAAFGPNGLRLLTERDGLFQVRDGTTGEPVGAGFPHAEIKNWCNMIFSPDGSRLLLHVDWGVELRDVASGQPRGEPLPAGIYAAAFSRDGSRIITGHHLGVAKLWDGSTLEPIGSSLPHVTGHVRKTGADAVARVVFSPDGSSILTGGFDEKTRLWDAATLEPIGEPQNHQSEVKALAYSPDGSRVVTGYAAGTARLWDSSTFKPLGAPLHHEEIITSVAFSPDGSRFLTGSLDYGARLWDTATQKPIGPRLQHEVWWPQVSFNPDGREFLLTSGESATSQLWENPPGPLEADPDQIFVWAQLVTGLVLDDNGGISGLDSPTWQSLYVQLQKRGGPPTRALATSQITVVTDRDKLVRRQD